MRFKPVVKPYNWREGREADKPYCHEWDFWVRACRRCGLTMHQQVMNGPGTFKCLPSAAALPRALSAVRR